MSPILAGFIIFVAIVFAACLVADDED